MIQSRIAANTPSGIEQIAELQQELDDASDIEDKAQGTTTMEINGQTITLPAGIHI